MKKNGKSRILGRCLAKEMTRVELEKATGSSLYGTQTAIYPPDKDPGSGPILPTSPSSPTDPSLS